ncbi:MAG: hypothetical protein J1F18_04280 [Lachnospiraceae bacterium]|nr:hypothetical protein [Lachnospiraceae bacterium]
MKVAKRDILLLLGLIGILAGVGSYFLVYQPTMEDAEALEQENEELQARINDLSSKMDNKDSYIAQTESMNQEMEAIFDMFPVDVREEDGVLLAINQELIAPMMISSVGITSCEPVVLQDSEEDVDHTYEIDEIEEYEAQEGIGDDPVAASDAAAGGVDNSNMPSILMDRSVTMNYLVAYDGLKRGIKNITMQENRMSINNLTVSYDESTGLLSGTTVVDMYCIPGQPGKTYVEPNFSSVLLGSDNIFGSIELYGGGLQLLDNEAEGEEGEEGEEAE